MPTTYSSTGVFTLPLLIHLTMCLALERKTSFGSRHMQLIRIRNVRTNSDSNVVGRDPAGYVNEAETSEFFSPFVDIEEDSDAKRIPVLEAHVAEEGFDMAQRLLQDDLSISYASDQATMGPPPPLEIAPPLTDKAAPEADTSTEGSSATATNGTSSVLGSDNLLCCLASNGVASCQPDSNGTFPGQCMSDEGIEGECCIGGPEGEVVCVTTTEEDKECTTSCSAATCPAANNHVPFVEIRTPPSKTVQTPRTAPAVGNPFCCIASNNIATCNRGSENDVFPERCTTTRGASGGSCCIMEDASSGPQIGCTEKGAPTCVADCSNFRCT